MTKLRCIQTLVAEHREAERQLIKLQVAIEGAEPEVSGLVQAHETPEQLAEKFESHLTLHLLKEDEGLFPFLEKIFPGKSSPLIVMAKEHEKIKEAHQVLLLNLARLDQRYTAKESSRVSEASRSIRFLLQVTLTHFGKEEEILFPAAELHLTKEEDQEVLEKWQTLSINSANPSRAQVDARV